MKAVFARGNTIFLKDIPSPRPGRNEIKIKVLACGICGTDLCEREGTKEVPVGHEVSGMVIYKGEGVEDINDGQIVSLQSSVWCGLCRNCRNGKISLCENVISLSRQKVGGFAEEIVVPSRLAVPVEDLDPVAASLQEPLGVAIDIVNIADFDILSRLLIVGIGPVGLMCIAMAKRYGVKEIAAYGTSRRSARIEMARELGAVEVMTEKEISLSEYIDKFSPNRVIVTSPPSVLNVILNKPLRGAIVVFVGIDYTDKRFCSFDPNIFHFNKMQLRASHASPALYAPLALKLLKEGIIPVEKFISHKFSLEHVEEAFKVAKNGPRAIKVVVIPG